MTRQEAEKKRKQWPQEGKGQCRHSLLELATVNGGYVSENYYCVYCGEYFSGKQSSEQPELIHPPDTTNHFDDPISFVSEKKSRAARR